MNIYTVMLNDNQAWYVEGSSHSVAISRALRREKLGDSISVQCKITAKNMTMKEFKKVQYEEKVETAR